MAKFSETAISERIQSFIKKCGLGEDMKVNKTDEGVVYILSAFPFSKVNRYGAWGFLVDSEKGIITVNLMLGNARDAVTQLFIDKINANKPMGFSALWAEDGVVSLYQQTNYQTGQDLDKTLIALIKPVLSIIETDFFKVCIDLTTPFES